MVTITINGKKIEREFPNMAHALAFAYQNGECYNAEKIEIVKTADKQGAEKPEQKQTETAAGGDNPAQAGEGGSSEPGPGEPGYIKTLEMHTHEELVAYAKELNIKVGFFTKDADLIAAIRSKQLATKVDESGETETSHNDNAADGTDAAQGGNP